MNSRLLKIKMLEHGQVESFNDELVRVLKISRPTAISKWKGKSDFTKPEIETLKHEYGLTANDVDEIFFRGADNDSGRSSETIG